MKNYSVVTGAVHIHTIDSDGTGTHKEIAQLAGEVGLDFLMFADHMTLKSYHDGKEGYYGNVLVLIGYEHNDIDDCNHYLIFDNDEVFPEEMTAAEYVAAAANKGALGIMAHPDEIRGRDAKYRSYPWTDWEVTRYDGLEIWNQMSEWMENLSIYNKLLMLISPRKLLQSPTDRILQKWDEDSVHRKVVAIAGIDAHGFLYKAGPIHLTIFPYKVQLKSLRTHLVLPEPLSKDFETARAQIYRAIRECRVFMSNYRWGEARDFDFQIESGTARAMIGDKITLDADTRATVSLPKKGKIRLIGNGRQVAESKSRLWEYMITEPGVYRIEVYRRGRGWIFSNHIRVVDA